MMERNEDLLRMDAHTGLGDLARDTGGFLVRDTMLDNTSEDDLFGRFDVVGYEHLQSALGAGRGVILVGCHLGNHLSAMHWNTFSRGIFPTLR